MLITLIFVEAITCAVLGCFYAILTKKARSQLGIGPILLATGLPAAGFLLPSVWLVYAICIGAIPVVARKRSDIVPLYVFSLFLLPDLALGSAFGTLQLSSISTSTCLGLGALLAAFWRGGIRGGISRFDIPFAAVFAVLLFIVSRSTSFTNVLREFVDLFLQFGIPYILVSRLLKTPDDFRRLAVSLACAGSILASLLVAEFVLDWPFYRTMYGNLGLELSAPQAVKYRDGYIRAVGPFLDATAAGFCLTTAVLAATQIRVAFTSKLFHLGVIALLVVGVVPPQSRGAILGLAVGGAAIFLYRRSQTVIAALTALVGVLTIFFATVGLEEKSASTVTSPSSDTWQYRAQLMERGVEELHKSPLTGEPYFIVEERMQDLRQGEGIVDFVNTYLWVALLGGLFALLPFVGAFAVRLLGLWQLRPRLRRAGFASSPAAFTFAALLAPMAMLAFTSFGGRIAIFTFLPLATGTALMIAVRQPDRRGSGIVIAAAQPPSPPGPGPRKIRSPRRAA